MSSATLVAHDVKNPGYQAFRLLHVIFFLAPLLAGIDKFFNVLAPWETYLSPLAVSLLPISVPAFLMVVGVIEVVAAFVVLFAPRYGGYLVAGWLGAIIVNLLLTPEHLDIALRDLGLLIGAVALARLAAVYQD